MTSKASLDSTNSEDNISMVTVNSLMQIFSSTSISDIYLKILMIID